MTTNTQQQSGNTQDRPARKPYVKPAFEFERVFETMALACGKINATQGSCHFNRRLS